ncbi:hypothetical protein BH11BAC2_BH11BAC2_13040 [soil metagenome]
MKNLLLTCLFVVVSIGVYSQTASLGTYPSSHSGQTYRSIHDYLGLNGANTLTTNSSFYNNNVNTLLREFKPSYLRYPGGTLANYWDWKEGWLFRNMADNGCQLK